MLRADQIELAILTLIIDWHDSLGRAFRLPQLEIAISEVCGPASDREVVEALLVLHQSNLLEFGSYVGSDFVSYSDHEGREFFYNREFRCRPLPGARRRQQELSRNNRSGVFISHIAEEKVIALRLQRLLQGALSPLVPIFVSSDYKSIESGEKSNDAILDGLKRSQVVIVLISRDSVDRRWINFEAGFGMGQEGRVIPVTSRGFSKGDIGWPLGQLQARDLHDSDDVRALLEHVANVCGVDSDAHLLEEFVGDLPGLEAQIPSTCLKVRVFRQELALRLAIRNTGNRPLAMVDAELLIPEKLRGNNSFHSYSPVRETARYEEDGIRWIGQRLTTQASQQLYLGIEPLRAVLSREMGEVLVTGLTIGLSAGLPPVDMALPIRYRVSAQQETVGPVVIPIAQIPEG